MEPKRPSRVLIVAAVLSTALTVPVRSQGNADPLGPTGMDRLVVPDVRTRGMGRAGVGAGLGAGTLFTNPALLTSVTAGEIRLGGWSAVSNADQRQEWYPDKLYATLSLLFEKRLSGIIDTAQRKLERAYDDIGPNWEKSSSATRPLSAVAAMPVDIGLTTLVVSAGLGEATNLDHYFQNNNALTPHIGAYAPAPIPRPALGETVKVAWFQHFRERVGSVYGITPGFAVRVGENISIGGSATILTGSTDDEERSVGRGRLRLTTSATGGFNVYFVDSVQYAATTTGTSTFSGTLGKLGLAFRNENFVLGAVVQMPATITRSWSQKTERDSMGASSSIERKGDDKLKLPLTTTFGLALLPRGGWTVAIDYAMNNLDKATYTPAGGLETKPWVKGNAFRVGVEYTASTTLKVRAGYCEDMQAFTGEGAAIRTDPIRGSVFTCGAGLDLSIVNIDVAYEYGKVSFQDMWTSNVNYTTRTSHTILAEATVRF